MANISRDFLDQILREGDRYYADSRVQNQVECNHLQPEGLIKTFTVFNQQIIIDIDQCGEGNFSPTDLVTSLTKTINNCVDICGLKTHDCGFLFIGHSKTVAFKILPTDRPSFLMFNSHCVDNNNCYPWKCPSKGVARLFRYLSPKSLANLLDNDHPRDGKYWQIYRIQIL